MEGRKRALPIPGHMLRRCGLLSRTSLPLTKNGAVGLLPRGKYEPEAIDLVSESASASESDPPTPPFCKNTVFKRSGSESDSDRFFFRRHRAAIASPRTRSYRPYVGIRTRSYRPCVGIRTGSGRHPRARSYRSGKRVTGSRKTSTWSRTSASWRAVKAVECASGVIGGLGILCCGRQLPLLNGVIE